VRHAEKLQQEDFAKEIGRDEILEPIVTFYNTAKQRTRKVMKTTVTSPVLGADVTTT
jgi:hypothetical protein